VVSTCAGKSIEIPRSQIKLFFLRFISIVGFRAGLAYVKL